MHYSSINRYLFLVILLQIHLFSFSQSSSESFGKNRIQRRSFEWKYLSTQNFNIYYYDNNIELAKHAAKQAEANFDRISNTIGFSPYSKIKLMIYSSIGDLHQSNIGLQDDEILIGGYTNFVKSRIEVAFRGTRSEFNKDINKGIANAIINVMMYGGSLKDVVQSSYLLALPDWFLEGASRYIAEGWSREMDNLVRDLMLQKKIRKPSSMDGAQAYLIGHSIWNFIAKKYGEDNIANILNLTRIVRDEEESIESTLGISYRTFIKEWEAYYRAMATKVAENHEAIDKSNRIKRSLNRNNEFRNLVSNPSGSKIAYSVHFKGKYKVVVTDSLHKKSKVIKRGGYKLLQQPENLNIPLLSWASNNTLGYIFKRKDRNYLRIQDVTTNKKLKLEITGVDEVIGFDFSDNSRFAILSAVKNGQSDIFIYDVFRQSTRQITYDAYDDIYPQFIDSTRMFVFSSNRPSDTLTRNKTAQIDKDSKFNIFKYDGDSSTSVLQRLTLRGNNYNATIFNNDIIYLGDRTGILNLYRYNTKEHTTYSISNFVKDINSYSLNQEQNSLTVTMLDKERVNLYYLKNFNFNNKAVQSSTPRQLYLDKSKNKKPDDLFLRSEDSVAREININEITFESDKKKNKVREKDNQVKGKTVKVQEFNGPYKNQNTFSVDKIVSTVQIDPLRGLGLYMEGGMSDMLGNHKMNAGLFQVIDLKSNDVYGEYLYLKSRLDFKARYDRLSYSLYSAEDDASNKYTLNKLSLSASYPFSVFDRISITPFIAQTRFSNTSLPALIERDVTRLYAGFRGEYVYDNTEVTGMNMIKGTKLKVAVEQYYNAGRFGRITLDLRHYQPIHKEIVFATRMSFGSFFGPSQKNFVVGGMDNWLFNSTYKHTGENPLRIAEGVDNSDILFTKYITSLRGFDYNTIFGSKFLLLNGEIRVPIVRYLYNGTITSNFFRNLQIIGFGDIGTAYSGNNPFNKDNNLNKRIVNNGNGTFVATVINYKNPFLIGYGLGARTLFLGYYVKLDVAWGVINYQRQDPRVYLTLGYDF